MRDSSRSIRPTCLPERLADHRAQMRRPARREIIIGLLLIEEVPVTFDQLGDLLGGFVALSWILLGWKGDEVHLLWTEGTIVCALALE